MTIAATSFVAQVYSTGVNNGVPVLRAVAYPGAFSADTREELIRNTREVLWPQIVDALTKPITDAEIAEHRKATAKEAKDVVFTGTIGEVNKYFTETRWSDGLPIVPPTTDKVEEFLKYTDLTWDETLCILPIAHRATTVWQVAVNGVMAGCPPEYMPLLIAYTKALTDPNYQHILGSTHSWTPYCWVNGPLARQLGIDSQQGLITEPRNAVLGRFLSLTMLNLCGYNIKQDRMGTFGYPMSWCMAEDEKTCLEIGWTPYHVQRGFDLNQSTLTAASALMWGNNLTPATPNPEKIMQLMAWEAVEKQQFATGSGNAFAFRTILVTGSVARDLARGYSTKEKLERALIATARRTAYERAFASYWANPGSAYNPARYTLEQHIQTIIKDENGELTEMPPWFPRVPGMERIYTVPVMKAGRTAILLAGDPDRNKVQCMPGSSYVTIEIKLPANWDELMAKLGYRPLKEFFLK